MTLALWKDCSGFHTPVISSGLHLSHAELCLFKQACCRLWKGTWIGQVLGKLLAMKHEYWGAGWSGTSVQSIADSGEAWQSLCSLHFFFPMYLILTFIFLSFSSFFFFWSLLMHFFHLCLPQWCLQAKPLGLGSPERGVTNNLFAKGFPAAAGDMSTTGEDILGPLCFILGVMLMDVGKLDEHEHRSSPHTCGPFSFEVMCAFVPVLLLKSIFQYKSI